MNASNQEKYQLNHAVRFITATSLFDGHDASINVIRRILQASGAEVIHLGHNRSVQEVLTAAIQEDVQGIALSSYQGGHCEYLKYLYDQLKAHHCSHIKIFAGGGGVITPKEIAALEAYGIEKIYSPQDGQRLGLQGIINDMLARSDFNLSEQYPDNLQQKDHFALARTLTALHDATLPISLCKQYQDTAAEKKHIPVVGITGTGGAGKSSLTDELIGRFTLDNPDIKIAVLALDPTRRKVGGALLGDRIRMNAIDAPGVFMHSFATRNAKGGVIPCLADAIAACKCCDFDIIIVETPGVGQGDADIVPFVDISMYVMTPEFGAASQLEKIDMLDFADLVAINKFDRKGAEDALRDVRKQIQRNRTAFSDSLESMPVYGTMASHFTDIGVTALYFGLLDLIHPFHPFESKLLRPSEKITDVKQGLIPGERNGYLANIANTVRSYHDKNKQQANAARRIQHLTTAKEQLADLAPDELDTLIKTAQATLTQESKALLDEWDTLQHDYRQASFTFKVRHKEINVELQTKSLSGLFIPKIALPRYHCHGDRLLWLSKENVAGHFPYTAGVFPFKRQGEDPSRLFAGEGDPARTNRRFKLLSKHSEAKRLSTAFDSVTLYGYEPNERPDIYGKVGNSGVSVASLDDMKILYDGFDLADPKTSVSMTINGPAPTLLAYFLNTAIDQQCLLKQQAQGELSKEEKAQVYTDTLKRVRGTVQADILKEDQGQNTCIFSTEFSLKMMVDIQEYFVKHQIKNFYSVSISGYHIAEAGANPISQLAFTLANGFTFVEAYLARGLHIDDFAANLSFFFSNGMDPEYAVMGRVARRIWAIAMRDLYGANKNSQRLKYHVQTSGRSLHAQEMSFNDIRTTLEALIALYDNCNSLHTNAYNEAITTPTEESVRRALAIQLIINKEWGLSKNENPQQGAFIIDELTDLVEEAVLKEFERISERGGVLGAMETGYQRGKIQDESLYYETLKHSGALPLIGVNSFLDPNAPEETEEIELARSTEQEKQNQLNHLHRFQEKHAKDAPQALEKLKQAVINHENIFETLMQVSRVCSLGQITQAFFEVGGKYRRNM